MSKLIDLVIMTPPAIDQAQFVGVFDENNEQLAVGQWLAPDGDNPYWRFRLTPAELLMMLIMDAAGPGERAKGIAERLQAERAAGIERAAGQSARQALRDKLGKATKRTVEPVVDMPDPAATEKCPACKNKFNPTKYELLDCGQCGESKCTAVCFDNLASPCKDCQALSADPDEGGFDPTAGPPSATIKSPELRAKMAVEQSGARSAVGSRLFDDTFHGKTGDTTNEDDE